MNALSSGRTGKLSVIFSYIRWANSKSLEPQHIPLSLNRLYNILLLFLPALLEAKITKMELNSGGKIIYSYK